jgi:hypothetical protein
MRRDVSRTPARIQTCSGPSKAVEGAASGVVSKVTLRVRELPEFWGGANFTVKAPSDDAYRRLLRQFVSFYREQLFNDHWGEQAHVNPDNTLGISMVVPRPGWRAGQEGLEAISSIDRSDPRPGAGPANVWWTGDGGQVGWFIYGFESLWLPASLLEDDSQERLANALFASARHGGCEHCTSTKGLPEHPPTPLRRRETPQ